MAIAAKRNLIMLQQAKTAPGLAALAGLGLFLRLWQIKGALWYDEAFSAWLAGLPLKSLFFATLYDVHPPPIICCYGP